MPSIVRIADPRGSTPRPLSLVMVGVSGVMAGLLLVQVSLAAERPDAGTVNSVVPASDGLEDINEPDPEVGLSGAPEEEESGNPAEPLDEDSDGATGADGDATDTAADQVESPDDTDDTADAHDAADAPEPGSNAAPSPGPARTVTRGRVAYFQCPGDRCSRDHGLEGEVFQALERVSGCMGGPGEGDVRVTVDGGAVTDVRFRERGARGLDIGVLDRCLSPPLRRISGSPLPAGVVVSFRFDVE